MYVLKYYLEKKAQRPNTNYTFKKNQFLFPNLFLYNIYSLAILYMHTKHFDHTHCGGLNEDAPTPTYPVGL